MRIHKCIQWAASALGLGFVGCDSEGSGGEDIEGDALMTARALVDNGEELNGTRFNGTRFNGALFNGAEFAGAQLMAAYLPPPGSPLGGWSLAPGTSKLQATDADGRLHAGNKLAGAMLEWEIDDELAGPTGYVMKIVGATRSPEWPDVYFTKILVAGEDGEWGSFCHDGDDQQTHSIALPGYFDDATASWHEGSGQLTFGCRGTAAGKCIEWGYRVWASQGGAPLADYFRACTRMVRADYCGTNVAHTTNGTAIDVADALAPAIQASATDWEVEAKWGPDGAVCLNAPRKLAHARAAVVAECEAAGRGTLPVCADAAPGEHGGLLMTRAVPG